MLLGNPHTLPGGLRVRLRLPHVSDGPALRDLLARLGLQADELEVRRALRFDPLGPAVTAFATAFLDAREQLVGVASGGRRTDLLLADEVAAPGIGALLEAALRERAAARAA